MNLLARLMVLSLVAALVLTVPAVAQVGFGVKGGLNVSNLTGADSEGFDSRVGLVAGGFVKLNIAPNLAIQPEALFAQKGSKGDLGGVTAKFNLNYFEIPVLLKYTFPTTGEMQPFLFVGPAVAFAQKAEFTVEAGGQSASLDIANEKSNDVGLVIGGGIDLATGGVALVIDARVTLGLSKAFEDVPPFDFVDVFLDELDFPMAWESGQALDVKNGAFALMIGVAF
ncbi:MAG: PorT family protein [candidate division Zixibacteria bacterium]|nr:PorT family protein [candidate division Zixibacteria bacterium]MDH3938952.1 PorT family protein [candidate division Zixibacteria bacterium]MDH4033963.1 PorT family protein [candidate division Zixibacteria bacterium]